MKFKIWMLAVVMLLGVGSVYADNITPIRTDVSGFSTWTDTNVAGTTYLQLLVAGANTISPAMNFNNYSSEKLDFKARTFGGSTAAEIIITISISVDNGSNWSVLGTVSPTNNTLTAQTQINISSYNGTQVKIKFSVAGTSNTIGVGIDDITISGNLLCTTPTYSFNSSSVNKFTTDANFTNAFTCDNTSPKVWSSTNEAVATVNSSTGEVDVVGAGTTSIQVNQVADVTYCAVVNASYTLTVSAPAVPEPTNHASSFTATTNSASQITVTWTDATGGQVPDGYLVKASTGTPTAPADFTAEADAAPLVKNITQGTQTAVFTGLSASTTYNFSIWPYTNSGVNIDYKISGQPTANATTSAPLLPTVLQAGDIAILQINSTNPDRFAFITFVDLNPNTVINFTDNGFSSSSTVRTGEGFLTYTTPTIITAGTVITWNNGMTISGTGWSSNNPSNFALASPDQLFAYQGNWDNNQTLIYGVSTTPWITTGTATSNNSYFPNGLTDNVNAFGFTSTTSNAYFAGITNGAISAIKSLFQVQLIGFQVPLIRVCKLGPSTSIVQQ